MSTPLVYIAQILLDFGVMGQHELVSIQDSNPEHLLIKVAMAIPYPLEVRAGDNCLVSERIYGPRDTGKHRHSISWEVHFRDEHGAVYDPIFFEPYLIHCL